MRIIVVSDTHRNVSALNTLVKEHYSDADVFIHLGDGEKDFDTVSNMYSDKQMYFVSGNCDSLSLMPSTKILDICSKRIVITHGHAFSVKSGTQKLIDYAKSVNADIVLYGHTHVPENRRVDEKLYIMNPGSLGKASYGVYGTFGIIDIVNGNILMNISEFHNR